MKRVFVKWCVVAAVVGTVACEGSPTEVGDQGDVDEVLAVAGFVFSTNPSLGSANGIDTTMVRACPEGGEVVIAGRWEVENFEGGITQQSNVSQALNNCAFVGRSGGTVSANGTVSLSRTARLQITTEGLELVSGVSTQVGQITLTADGVATACDYDLVRTFDADTNEYVVKGVLCGREVSTRWPGP